MKAEYTALLDMEKILDYFPEENGLVRVNIYDEQTGGEKWVFINDKGEIAGGRKWDWADGFIGGFARVIKGDKAGMVNEKGEVVVPAIWNAVESVCDGHMVVKQGANFGAVDAAGRMVIVPEWDELSGCSEGCFIAKKDGEYFILDANGKEAIEVKWECRHIEPFRNGVALIMDDENCRYGLIDRTGGLIEPPIWESATRMFPGGRRYVRMDGKLWLVRMVEEED